MTPEFWHDAVADKSFSALQELRKTYNFVLIGGWAVFLYTHGIKSKDIDIVVETETLGRLKTNYTVIKNDRLKKYEIKLDGFDVDIYLSHWSELGLPASTIYDQSTSVEGFKIPQKEILLVLKLATYRQRKGSLKGRKDALDVLSLLLTPVDFSRVKQTLQIHRLDSLCDELTALLASAVEVKELGLNRKQYADFKKRILKFLK